MAAEARLGGGVELLLGSKLGKALVHDGHKYLCEGRGYCNTPVVMHILRVSFTFVDGGNFGVSPVLGGQLGDGAVVQEVC